MEDNHFMVRPPYHDIDVSWLDVATRERKRTEDDGTVIFATIDGSDGAAPGKGEKDIKMTESSFLATRSAVEDYQE
jgi:hypothetical protein